MELPVVLGVVSPVEATVAVFLAHEVVTVVDSTVGPGLVAFALLFIVDPLAFVLCSVHVEVFAFSLGFIVLPETDINVTISMN